MSLTDWYKIKEAIYYSDGSWRDIYVLDTTQDDWSKWVDLLNQKYSIEFYNGQTQQTEPSINKQVVFGHWERKTDFLNGATIKLENIAVKCHFFTTQEIENDIDPREIETIEDHYRIVNYLIDISKLLNKTVILTAENQRDLIYITVDRDNVNVSVE
ncbi:MAG: hypothetical protein WDN26_06050 [Chitinophagaceae bacterium]